MKLINANFKNFRLLKKLKLDFSSDPYASLTVIRAANETGKTTCLYGLMWALYGSKVALPNGGDYSLYPAGHDSPSGGKVEVSVEVEFSIDRLGSVEKYRLVRSCQESSRGPSERSSEVFKMYKLGPEGTEPVSSVEAVSIVENSLPRALKGVYFTDGDSAMAFIEAAATQGVKRKRVSNAVESLLGLELVKSTVKHLNVAAKKFSSEIDDTDYATKLDVLNDQIEGFTEDIEQWELELREIESQITDGDRSLKSIRASIEEALKLGDKQKLAKNIEEQALLLKRLKGNAEKELNDLSKIISNKECSRKLIGTAAGTAIELLEELSVQKQLPKVNIPILQELLERKDCFCGAELSGQGDGVEIRRGNIQNAIEASREADAIQEAATSLFYRSRGESVLGREGEWTERYAEIQERYQNTTASISDCHARIRQLDEQVRSIDDSHLQELKEQESSLEIKISSLKTQSGTKVANLEEYSHRRKDAEEERSKLEKREGKKNNSFSKLNLTRDAQKVFQNIIEKLKGEELRKVSREMNRIFLEMIGSDPEANDLTLITEAVLTEEYDIRVYGPRGVELNPDQDLNGASRRAITLAFILALTKVSDVEAPNVIDTPLGMMSGFVKQSVLMHTITEGTQAILFLTHDEIRGVEKILDKYAGKVFTLTNPAHYPKMLKNEPNVSESRVLRCECTHREVCETCERLDVRVG